MGKYIIDNYLSGSAYVKLLSGVKNAEHPYVISQNETNKSYIPIKRSYNEEGIKFTYTSWLYIENIDNELHHVFHKGDAEAKTLFCPAVSTKI